ncbi:MULTISPECIES: hypothetical protein [unclassified Sphingobium]|uniref:hypothetical protein n=1 Tax=unclassified Sphingobium TaxID=2611147 RepID=UPI0011203204|nr:MULTISPECIES: hypothetical protein [Sphingomonadaceae]NML91495.1 hypothetical protein [Sphingobium sp. TB-6]
MADWLGPALSGIFELAGSLIPTRRGDPFFRSAPLWKRISVLILVGIFAALGSVLVSYLIFAFLAFILKALGVGT